MRNSDEYRRRAAECVRLAQEAESGNDKARHLQMAECWNRLNSISQSSPSKEISSPPITAPKPRILVILTKSRALAAGAEPMAADYHVEASAKAPEGPELD